MCVSNVTFSNFSPYYLLSIEIKLIFIMMKNNLSSIDIGLITLWSVLLVSSLYIKPELLFGWPIQVHLTITGALIAFKFLIKSRNLAKS